VIAMLRRLLVLTRAPRGRAALSVLLGAATVVCGVGLMASAGYLISRAAEHPDVLALGVTIVGVRFFGLTRPIARYLERLASHDLAFRVLGRVRSDAYRRLEPLSPGEIQDVRRGDLLTRLVADVDALQYLHLRGVGPAQVALVAGSVSVLVTAAFLPSAAIALAAGLLAAAAVAPVAAAFGRRAGRTQVDARGALTADLVEGLMAAPELAVYGGVDDRLATLSERDRALVRSARVAALVDGAGEGARLLLAGVTTTAVLALAVAAHADGRLDRTLVAMLTLLALASFEAVQALTQGARDLAVAVAAGGRLFDVLDRESRVTDPAEPAAVPDGPVTIAFEDVAVRYPGSTERALDGFSLRLEPGRRIALTGPSGAGKTTAVNLLLRFVDPERGRVTLDGRDLRAYRQDDVRAAIAVAGQDAHLFSASIRDNVALGRAGASDAEIADALRRAAILDWVRGLPAGLDTLVGEEGRELSGGQRQRLILARALLADRRILVLDEPTAHLDVATAERLIDDVLAAAGATTVLLITHRSEGLHQMDHIVEVGGPGPSDLPLSG
jgi:thiol reductant ABC exporter CydC subunit